MRNERVPGKGARSSGLLLRAAVRRLDTRGVEEPELNAQWLLADALGTERLALLTDLSVPVPAAALRRFENGLVLKESGLPLAYILGWQNFRGLKIKVDARVLVPRPETEELAGLAADYLKPFSGDISALDYGAGSGAIGLWLAHRFPVLKVTAVEKSARALACARENAAALGLAGRINFIRAETLAGMRGKFNLIVSNPPYIPTRVINGLSPEVLSEPRMALDGGGDGLGIARMLIALSPGRLKKGGAMLLEVGGGQAKNLLARMSAKTWTGKKLFKDLNGVERFVFGMTK
ncbi:MAG: protein-(glutamine-N5) methyltransferase, release factor-specific [Elusimicrobia bacterium RIFOXYA2_FULL_58_8]|nr:MAG: protein-(glutamine-N5) methyltransferase, release factor-specific [Elusimicrobia bacterium RIFOXYA12_FULL_57_11]OGS13116.1 MAG: protein-(glutamine-N5) methyltransferase, release factor-specific [Elusimicrobia bacterium RIFOXYA2_FULL_58_8]